MFKNEKLLSVLQDIDLGSGIAEQDDLLEDVRVETSALTDLLQDKVDLIPGNKGSGKSALYRIFVEFLPDSMLEQHKAVIAHGVNRVGDEVFHVFKDDFEKLTEQEFVDFWCIYIVSLVHEQFLKNERYAKYLESCESEIDQFKRTCDAAGIPDISAKKTLKNVLDWVLHVALPKIRPRLKYKLPEDMGEFNLTLFGPEPANSDASNSEKSELPRYVDELKRDLEAILLKCGLNIWFMIDKLDEIFPRRSQVERRALRGLLRTLRIFESAKIRIKVFLRDDMLDEIVSGGEGFVALSHITARKADTLRWSEDQIITMIAKRLFNSNVLVNLFEIDKERLDASLEYRKEALYKIFPAQVHKGSRQSSTLSWIYKHISDANGVATPRDVIHLLTSAKQHQYALFSENPTGESTFLISSQAILYGLEELSKHKKTTYLSAEFPHLWPHIEKFTSGKADYTEKTLKLLLGKEWKVIAADLESIGFLTMTRKSSGGVFRIPQLYRKGLQITQGMAD